LSFMGELRDIGVADLLYLLALRRQTGKLAISCNGEEVSLFLDRGQLILVTSSNMSLRLGRMLVRMGFLDADGLRDALQSQEQIGRGRPLGRLLLERGYVTEAQLSACVEEQCVEILGRVISSDHGTFVYHRGATAPPGTEIVPLNADRIVMEATSRTDEMTMLRELLPDDHAPLMLTDGILEQADTLSDVEVFLAAALQPGATSALELATSGIMEERMLWRTLIGLRDRGLIVVGDGEPATDPEDVSKILTDVAH
jgi:hypothetical protein